MDLSAAEVKRATMALPSSPQTTQSDPNGSEILVRCLQAEGVKFLWGYPGGAVLYIYDALYKQNSIEHVLVRHEQAAIHAADGVQAGRGQAPHEYGGQFSAFLWHWRILFRAIRPNINSALGCDLVQQGGTGASEEIAFFPE